ncbi:MAG: hypothetical protein IPN36_16845 [Bacteroidetes bacterium]|nr:hypothetical protein [Bacteroidota bacterium]
MRSALERRTIEQTNSEIRSESFSANPGSYFAIRWFYCSYFYALCAMRHALCARPLNSERLNKRIQKSEVYRFPPIPVHTSLFDGSIVLTSFA